MKTETYNGWTNRATWLLYTEFELGNFMHNLGRPIDDFDNIDTLASMIRDYVYEMIELDCNKATTNAFIAQSLLHYFNEVNFHEIANHIVEDVREPIIDLTNTTQLYIDEMDVASIKEVFDSDRSEDYVFRHSDCPYVFTTDGIFIYAMDMDEKNVDPFTKYGVHNVMNIYNDFNEFLRDFKRFEEVLGRELYLSDEFNNTDVSIRSLELYYRRDYKRERE